ncbi:MAG: hypothetical protein DMF71_00165 [Acidobacteria bacterium]|nr:MAG: hypothetical protein DMF71_00165 [Acidobacteriota bacterium]
MQKTEKIFILAQTLADERPYFFDIKGPSLGDHDTSSFMKELRSRALRAFNEDYAEKKICGENNLCVDYYFRDEATIIEVALGLRNPTSEYERDILKAIMAKNSGFPVRHLLFISKPGALKRLAQPGAGAIAAWAAEEQGIKIEVREIARMGRELES